MMDVPLELASPLLHGWLVQHPPARTTSLSVTSCSEPSHSSCILFSCLLCAGYVFGSMSRGPPRPLNWGFLLNSGNRSL